MKDLFKGVLLGISVILLNRLCCYLLSGFSFAVIQLCSLILFFAVITAFLVSKKLASLFLCGFTGLFVMFVAEICFIISNSLIPGDFGKWLMVYVGGLQGAIFAIIVSIILTISKKSLISIFYKEELFMKTDFQKCEKIKMLIYWLASAISFSYLVMPENAGISVPIFILLQAVMLWFLVPERKKLLLLIPIFMLSLNPFLSSSNLWNIPNFIICVILFISLFTKFEISKDNLAFFANILRNILLPFKTILLPFKWVFELNDKKTELLKRIVIALAIAVPVTFILTLVLSNADMVFSLKTETLFAGFLELVSFRTLYIILCGIFAGLYLFGVVLHTHTGEVCRPQKEFSKKGDLIIINILLTSILFVYTLFVIIQFKYLFAGSNLPEGLTYAKYARKGFFELLTLTGVNIVIILFTVKLTKHLDSKWCTLTKVLCHYLCAVTIILLISSFYRMMLYTESDGLTRLRFFVLGFLIFEAFGLLITFLYIARPKFNIVLIYIVIAIVYYTLLNLVPTDNIIAKNQIDKYLNGERDDLTYVFTLSADVSPAIQVLYEKTDDEQLKNQIVTFIDKKTSSAIPKRWQRYNLSTEQAKRILFTKSK